MASGLFFLFSRGKRPSRAAVGRMLEDIPRCAISHDPSAVESGKARAPDRAETAGGNGGSRAASPGGSPADDEWLELLVDGLTFDLLGLAPGPALASPPLVHRFNCPAELSPDLVEAVGLVPGPHLSGGANTIPVVRTLVGLGAEFAERLPGMEAVSWGPARSAIAPPFFVRTADAWLDGGPFPALGLVGYAIADDGMLRSEGLGFFIGQELVLDADLSGDPIAGTRLAARIVHELVGTGALEKDIAIAGPERMPFWLRPSPDKRLITVSRM